ncbi:MAG: hypothetical protein M3367_04730, partial [Acidobacteriota bacterium]|nr:hypothetical protein [Acidobacteriota bacterium]
MRTNKINLLFVLGMFLIFGLACNYKFGAESDSSKKEVSLKENSTDKPKRKSDTKKDSKTSSDSETESPSKLGSYNYQRFDYSLYQIPKNLSEDELIKIAQDLHEREPKTILLLVDDDEQAEQFITYHKQLEDFYEQSGADKPKVEYPNDWANKHII